MELTTPSEPFVLSLYLNTRGFGYALFEGILAPVDWGIKTIKAKRDTIEQVRLLLHLFNPKQIVLQSCGGTLSRCTKRMTTLLERIAKLAQERGIKVFRYSRDDIRGCFAYYGARTKDEIAPAIAKVLPEFAPRVPPMRKLWQSEAYWMPMFDALALVFTYYANERLRRA